MPHYRGVHYKPTSSGLTWPRPPSCTGSHRPPTLALKVPRRPNDGSLVGPELFRPVRVLCGENCCHYRSIPATTLFPSQVNGGFDGMAGPAPALSFRPAMRPAVASPSQQIRGPESVGPALAGAQPLGRTLTSLWSGVTVLLQWGPVTQVAEQ